MRHRVVLWAAGLAAKAQMAAAHLDPDVVQWPGGSLIAVLLWIYVMVRTA